MNEENTNTNEQILDVVKTAAPHRVKIDVDIADKFKELLYDYLYTKIDGDERAKRIFLVSKKSRSDEDKEYLKAFVKSAKKEFKTAKSFLYPSNPLARPIETLAEKVATLVKILHYIGNSEFVDALATHGVRVDADAFGDDSDYFKSESVKGRVTNVFDTVGVTQTEAMNEKAAINEEAYSQLPPNLIYSPDNKSGITVSQFNKLVKTKAISIMKSSEEFTEYKKRQLEKDKGSLESQQIAFEATKEM